MDAQAAACVVATVNVLLISAACVVGRDENAEGRRDGKCDQGLIWCVQLIKLLEGSWYILSIPLTLQVVHDDQNNHHGGYHHTKEFLHHTSVLIHRELQGMS